MAERYDVIILGGGNAGFGVSAIAHDAGKKIAFVEERDFGGTCPNRGCTPKKVLVAARVCRGTGFRRHLPEPRVHAQEGSGRRGPCAP
jgi:pyruvate/2-oxoglutarate dehydrogenase complex dihydrolipoamide dehydrogenase (E3) component